jgi:cation-transporting ATPase 13A3/4/5
MTTIFLALAIVMYMVFTPASWLRKLMQLTRISTSFKITLLLLGLTYLVFAWICENYIFQRLARAIGKAKTAITKTAKKRKDYKIILERTLS